ncbi:hypothetical protein GGI15_001273 [Coemansia interrupta]|uniref:Uncharacterized protein n=1 Tax=Coemansia interrupta TaxID=1126814 RepID=A0A9W8LP18_9FUNG|nr:hypothetical protein GGI15_001273 [Coemansia interrupta]
MRAPQLLLLASALVAAFPANQSTTADELVSASIQSTTETAPIPNESVDGKIRVQDDLSQNESVTSTAAPDASAGDADPTADALDQVDGVDRHKGHHHHCHDGHKDKCEKEKPTCEKEEHKCNGCNKATPTYHINIECEDSRYKTISLPAQGCPYVYGEDVQACCPQPPPPQPCCPPPPFIYDECCDDDAKKKHKKLDKLKSKIKSKKSKHKGGDGYQGRYANDPNVANNENNNINGNPQEEDEE